MLISKLVAFDQKLSKFENSNGSSNCLPYRMQNHTDYISLNVVHYAFSNGSSNVLPEMMRNHIGSICLTFLHCVFSNKSSKCLLDKKQNHTFAIVCFQMGPQIPCLIRCIATLVALREAIPYHFSCFFYKVYKRPLTPPLVL